MTRGSCELLRRLAGAFRASGQRVLFEANRESEPQSVMYGVCTVRLILGPGPGGLNIPVARGMATDMETACARALEDYFGNCRVFGRHYGGLAASSAEELELRLAVTEGAG